MHWEATLTGPPAVFDELARRFSTPDLFVTAGGVLRSSVIDNASDADAARSEAERIASCLSGICRLLLDSAEPLRVSNLCKVAEDGKRHFFMLAEPGVLKITGGLTSIVVKRADGTVEEQRPSDPAPAWLHGALQTPDLLRALALRDAGELSWTDWYRLFEVICHGVGGESEVVALGWASRTAIGRFKHSANSLAVAGDEARHGVERTDPPSAPMNQTDARLFVDGLLRRWLESRG